MTIPGPIYAEDEFDLLPFGPIRKFREPMVPQPTWRFTGDKYQWLIGSPAKWKDVDSLSVDDLAAPYAVGARLHIREPLINDNGVATYEFGGIVDAMPVWFYSDDRIEASKMPLIAARWFVTVTAVTPELLQNIDDDSVESEIGEGNTDDDAERRDVYIAWWNSRWPLQQWASNPWTWRVDFELDLEDSTG